jgi:hypothetical protein
MKITVGYDAVESGKTSDVSDDPASSIIYMHSTVIHPDEDENRIF